MAFIDSHLAIARALTSSSFFFSSIFIGWGDVWFLRPWQPVPHKSWFSGRVTSYRQRVFQTSRNSRRWNFKTHAMNMYRARCNKSLWRAARVACFARRPGSSVCWTSVDESSNDCSLHGANLKQLEDLVSEWVIEATFKPIIRWLFSFFLLAFRYFLFEWKRKHTYFVLSFSIDQRIDVSRTVNFLHIRCSNLLVFEARVYLFYNELKSASTCFVRFFFLWSTILISCSANFSDQRLIRV